MSMFVTNPWLNIASAPLVHLGKGFGSCICKNLTLERFLGGWIFNCRKVSEVKYWCRRVAIVVLRQRFWVSLQILWEVLDQGWRLVQGFGFKCWVCSMLVHEVLWRPSWRMWKKFRQPNLEAQHVFVANNASFMRANGEARTKKRTQPIPNYPKQDFVDVPAVLSMYGLFFLLKIVQ